MKVFLKTLLAILVAIVILTNLIWFRPWSLNLVYEKTFVEVISRAGIADFTWLGRDQQRGLSFLPKAHRFFQRRPAKDYN